MPQDVLLMMMEIEVDVSWVIWRVENIENGGSWMKGTANYLQNGCTFNYLKMILMLLKIWRKP